MTTVTSNMVDWAKRMDRVIAELRWWHLENQLGGPVKCQWQGDEPCPVCGTIAYITSKLPPKCLNCDGFLAVTLEQKSGNLSGKCTECGLRVNNLSIKEVNHEPPKP